ncbi:unnamed protein product, partial [Adineta ricciae]
MKYATNDIFNQFIEIRQKQAAIWEEQQMLETRILCQFLPPHFDALERFISPVKSISLNNEQRNIRLKNERLKIIQEAKRKWLRLTIMDHEMKLQDYDVEYQQVLQQFKSNVPVNAQETHNTTLHEINHCMMQHTNRLKQDIAKRMLGYQRRLQRNHRRSSRAKNLIGVSPEPYLDLKSNPFSVDEWNYLKLGPSFIRLNQSAIRPQQQQQIELQHEHDGIFSRIQDYLVQFYQIPRTASIFQEYSHQLLNYLYQSYSAPVPYKDRILAQQQAQIVT